MILIAFFAIYCYSLYPSDFFSSVVLITASFKIFGVCRLSILLTVNLRNLIFFFLRTQFSFTHVKCCMNIQIGFWSIKNQNVINFTQE